MSDEQQQRVQRLIDNRHSMLGYDARAHCEAHGIDEQTTQASFIELTFMAAVGSVVLEAIQEMGIEEVRDRV